MRGCPTSNFSQKSKLMIKSDVIGPLRVPIIRVDKLVSVHSSHCLSWHGSKKGVSPNRPLNLNFLWRKFIVEHLKLNVLRLRLVVLRVSLDHLTLGFIRIVVIFRCRFLVR